MIDDNIIELKERVSNFIFISILIFYPLANLIYYKNPLDLLGINFYSLICYTSLYLIFSINIIFNQRALYFFILFLSIFFFTIFINFYIHINNYNYLIQYEIGVTSIMMAFLCLLVINNKNLNLVGIIIILSCLTQAIVSIYHEFTMVEKMHFLNNDSQNRQTGFLLNANLFSSFISVGFILNLHTNYFFKLFKKLQFKYLINILIAIIFYTAIYYSESRFSLYFCFLYLVLFLVYEFYKLFNLKNFLVISIVFIFFISILLKYFFSLNIDNRVAMGFNDSVRVLKYYLGIKTILLNHVDLLFGMDRLYFSQLRMNNVRLSDNSIIYLIMYLGLPYACIFFLSILYIMLRYAKLNILSITLFFGLVVNLFINGAIYWHVYLLYFFSIYFVIFKKIEQNN